MAKAADKRLYKIIIMGEDSAGRTKVFKYLSDQVRDKEFKEVNSMWTAEFSLSNETVQVLSFVHNFYVL